MPLKSFKIIEVGINRKPVCDFLLVINTKLTSYLVPFRSYRSLLFTFRTLCGRPHQSFSHG